MSFLRPFWKDPMLLQSPLSAEDTGITNNVYDRRYAKRKANFDKDPAGETPEVREAFRLVETLVRNQALPEFDVHRAMCEALGAITRIGTKKHAHLATELANFVRFLAKRVLKPTTQHNADTLETYAKGCEMVDQAERNATTAHLAAAAEFEAVNRHLKEQGERQNFLEAVVGTGLAKAAPSATDAEVDELIARLKRENPGTRRRARRTRRARRMTRKH
jgi:hypothetical protein